MTSKHVFFPSSSLSLASFPLTMNECNPQEEEDEEPTVFYRAAQDGLLASAADKQKSALTHFNYFLLSYCVQIGVPVATAADIPYHGLGTRKKNNKSIFEFWDSAIGSFITYMGNARQGCNPQGDRIAQSTAEGYCASVKGFFTTKFRLETPIPVFQPEQWRQLRNKLKGFFRESNRGKNVEGGHASSNRKDRENLSRACIWQGTPEFAEFWHLLNTSHHCAGRGSEVSLITATGTKVIEVEEDFGRYEVIAVDVQRQKDGPFQSLPVYPHRDGVLEDFYFSLIHLIVTNGCSGDFIFPNFSRASLKKKNGKSASKVSSEWNKLFKQLRDSFETLSDEINEKLTSHSHRGGSNQLMAETPTVSGIAQCYRSGWSVNNIHSVFDYVFGSLVLNHQAGKAVAGWRAKIGDVVVGGQPPTMADLDTGLSLFQSFVDAIFEDDVQGYWSKSLREMLVMTLVLRYDEFVDILQSHPFAKVLDESERSLSTPPFWHESDKVHNNLFICRINQILEKIGVDEDLWSCWRTEARMGFVSRNMNGLPTGCVNRTLDPDLRDFLNSNPRNDPVTISLVNTPHWRKILMDPRCFADHFNSLTSSNIANHLEVQKLKHVISDLRKENNDKNAMLTMAVSKICCMERSIERLTQHFMPLGITPGAPSTTPAPPKGLLAFSIAVKGLAKNASLAEVTTAFFVDRYPAGMELDQKSQAWKTMEPQDKRSLRNKLNSIKRAVKLVLFHVDTFPGGSDKESIKRSALIGEERIRRKFEIGPSAIITTYKLEKYLKQPRFKDMEKTMQLPGDTPGDVVKFFKVN